MATHKNTSVIDAFHNIFQKCYLESNPAIARCALEMQLLMGLYNLTPAPIIVLAFLLHYYPKEIGRTKLESLVKQWGEIPKDVLGALVDRGFLVLRKTSRLYCYSISDAAAEAIMYDKPFIGKLYDDCYKELLSCSLATIATDKWLAKFSMSLSLPNNNQFKIACEKLHILDLPKSIQKAFWMLAHWFINHFTDPFTGKDDNGIDVTTELDVLGKTGVAVYEEPEPDIMTKLGVVDDKESNIKGFVLSTKATRLLFNGHDEIVRYDDLSKYVTIIKSASIERKELFFSAQTQAEMDHLRYLLSEEGFDRAMKVLEKQKRNGSIQSLLWGPPGTGKTESVKQLAADSGRDIALFDQAKVMNCYIGESEKNYRAVFKAYNYIACVSHKAPILLLNEADSILAKRLTNLFHSSDKLGNNIANILLQEFEDLNGILLATTNLIDNLDPAFGRRFLFKTELAKPDAIARFKIWVSSIPELTKEDALKLAKLEMSGAQISNVVTKRDLAELYFTGDRGYAFIKRLCDEELATENGTVSERPRIGFQHLYETK